jgi:hypothetical protein
MARRKSTQPRKRRDRRTLTALGKGKINPNDPTLGGQIMMLVSGLTAPHPGSDPTWKLPHILEATKGRKEFFLKGVLGAFMIMREATLPREVTPPEEQFTKAKEILADFIARHWGKKIDPKKLEQKPHPWEWYADLKLGYDPEKLPKAPKVRTSEKETLDNEDGVEDDSQSNLDQTPGDALLQTEKAQESVENILDDDVSYDVGDYEPDDNDEEMDGADLEKMLEGGEFDEYD